ncbi:nitrate reductase molybdenum cofactor assembly chaperone [Nocardioides guangzhouensis]|uniref:Nitrate reductase molybdenum cofactor assembly chaperone n=1 Tax=Nocardioides guangzhouensis TaxID=2497878 RepID=A0A4V1XY79_9ACTN|nr:nitrate reductase molybdenum cofactor assembly chaperone [Nocardioides guangzhouensis]RYP82309.1 nitrate reductase molybdenum cofactor assembly chaperone [Nocardioides guangzhouensis]
MRRRAPDHRVVHQVASWCLDYPDQGLVDRLPLLRDALAEAPASPSVEALLRLVDHLTSRPLEDLQREYVDTFDLHRHCTLYLSYWTDGDTRRRGEVLGRFKAAYRASGFLVDTHGELPDHLPMVLEFAAVADPVAGTALLQDYRASLELVRLALLDRGSPYADGLVAVCATLPGASPSDRAAAMALAGPPPTEQVGLEPFDPRLLPLAGDGGRG